MFQFLEASVEAQTLLTKSLTYRNVAQVSMWRTKSGECAVSREIRWASPELQPVMVLDLSPVLR